MESGVLHNGFGLLDICRLWRAGGTLERSLVRRQHAALSIFATRQFGHGLVAREYYGFTVYAYRF